MPAPAIPSASPPAALSLAVALLAGLSLACAGGKGANGDDTANTGNGGGNGGGNGANGGDNGTDNGGSGGDNGGNGGDNGGDNGGSGPCPTYSGLRAAGAQWDWSYTRAYTGETGIAGGWTTTLESLSGGGDWVSTMDLDYASPSVDSYIATYRTEGYCDAQGSFTTASRIDYEMVTGGRTYTGWVETTYDPPALSLPADLAPGDTFEVRSAGTSRSNTGTDTPFDTTYTYRAGDLEDVEVPAGTFTTLPISYTVDGTRYTTWLDADVGGVASDSAELDAYAP